MSQYVFTTTPANTVAVAGSPILLQCGIDTVSGKLQWAYSEPERNRKRYIVSGNKVHPSHTDKYIINYRKNATLDLDLTIKHVEPSDAGIYECLKYQEESSVHSQVTILGK